MLGLGWRLPTSREDNFAVLRPLYDLSSPLARLSGDSLSMSCAAFVGENAAMGWRYVLRMWNFLINDPWLLVIWTLKDELRWVEAAMMMVVQAALSRFHGEFQLISHKTWQMNPNNLFIGACSSLLGEMSRGGDQLFPRTTFYIQ